MHWSLHKSPTEEPLDSRLMVHACDTSAMQEDPKQLADVFPDNDYVDANSSLSIDALCYGNYHSNEYMTMNQMLECMPKVTVAFQEMVAKGYLDVQLMMTKPQQITGPQCGPGSPLSISDATCGCYNCLLPEDGGDIVSSTFLHTPLHIYPRTILIKARRSKWMHDGEKILPDDLCSSYDHVKKIYPRTISIRARRSNLRDEVKKVLPDDLCSSYDHVKKIYPRTISIRARRSKWRHDVK
jgi:hypothetical protein